MKDFYIEKKVYYHDTDCGGVVYYANYLKYLEEARTEYCLNKGVILKDLTAEGTSFVVVHTEIDYKSPVRYQETLRVFTRIEKFGRSTIDFVQEIKKDDITVVIAKTTWVCVNSNLKPKAIPDNIKQSLSPANI